MIRNILIRTVITFCVLAFIQCQSSVDTIKERTIECLNQSKTIEFETEDGKKGFNHSVDMSCIIGSKLPLIEIENILGEVISTSDLLGKKSVIHFWFINCKPCVKEIPSLNNLIQNTDTKNINFLAISKDSNRNLESFLKKTPFNFNLFPNCEQLIKSEFGIMWGYPMTMITDENNIVKRTYGALSKDDIIDLKVYLNN